MLGLPFAPKKLRVEGFRVQPSKQLRMRGMQDPPKKEVGGPCMFYSIDSLKGGCIGDYMGD